MTLHEQQILEAGNLDAKYCLLRDQIRQGFPDTKRKLEPVLHPYWQVRYDLQVDDNDLVLFGTRLVIPKSLRPRIQADLYAGHRDIVGTKARARLCIYWPNLNAHVEQVCRDCPDCQYDRLIQPREPEIHLPTPKRAFQYVSADFADVDGKQFLISTDWRSPQIRIRQGMAPGDSGFRPPHCHGTSEGRPQ